MTTGSATPPRVVVHVGTPKSGTTFLQRAMWSLRADLEDAGVLVPGEQLRDVFRAAIEVRETHRTWGFTEDELAGTWDRLAAQAREFDGTTVLSHELLAAATPEQVARALSALQGMDVHVVVTARDLARQVMSEWQERIKNGSSFSFARFRRTVVDRRPQEAEDEGDRNLFWRYHDVADVLDRWAGGLAPDRVHVVVAPPSGGDPMELWRLFGEAVGFDGTRLVPEVSSANTSLGVVQIAALRRLNKSLDRRLPLAQYTRMVKRPLSQRFLATRRSARPECPRGLAAELRDMSEVINRRLEARRYAVHGDLSHLLPTVPESDPVHPDAVPDSEVAEELAALLAEELVLRAGRGERNGDPGAAVRPSAGRLARLRLLGRRTGLRVRERVAGRLRRGAGRVSRRSR